MLIVWCVHNCSTAHVLVVWYCVVWHVRGRGEGKELREATETHAHTRTHMYTHTHTFTHTHGITRTCMQRFDASDSSPALLTLMRSGALDVRGKRCVVPGCGRGYDAFHFALNGAFKSKQR